MTGAIAGQGMMGYWTPSRWPRAAAAVRRAPTAIADAATGERVVFVNADIACIFQSHHMGLMPWLRKRFGGLYTERNVNLNATYNHNPVRRHRLGFRLLLAAFGFKKNSYEAEVEGLFQAILQGAHDNLAPGTVSIGRGELHNASRNRSRTAFERNPKADRAHFPDAIDPRDGAAAAQGGRDVGAITWFPTHGTSLTDANKLISADNKGYASYGNRTTQEWSRHSRRPMPAT